MQWMLVVGAVCAEDDSESIGGKSSKGVSRSKGTGCRTLDSVPVTALPFRSYFFLFKMDIITLLCITQGHCVDQIS